MALGGGCGARAEKEEGWRLTSSPRFLASDTCPTLIMCILAIRPNIASDRFEAARSHELHDTVSERPRRWTRNPLGSARRGSNPLGVVTPCTVKKTCKRCSAPCASRTARPNAHPNKTAAFGHCRFKSCIIVRFRRRENLLRPLSSSLPPLPPTHPSAGSSFIPMRRLLRHRFQCSAISVF